MKKIKHAWRINLLIVILEMIGTSIALQAGWGVLQMYTVLSNLFVLLSSACLVASAVWAAEVQAGGIPRWVRQLRYMATCCSTLTFFMVFSVLVPMTVAARGDVGSLVYVGPMLMHHVLCPLLSFVSLAFLEPGIKRDVYWYGVAVIPTALYAVVMGILNVVGVLKGPYSFLLVYQQPWYLSVAWFVGILLGAFLIATVLGVISGTHSVTGEGRMERPMRPEKLAQQRMQEARKEARQRQKAAKAEQTAKVKGLAKGIAKGTRKGKPDQEDPVPWAAVGMAASVRQATAEMVSRDEVIRQAAEPKGESAIKIGLPRSAASQTETARPASARPTAFQPEAPRTAPPNQSWSGLSQQSIAARHSDPKEKKRSEDFEAFFRDDD